MDNIKIRLLGYYSFPNQKMNPESERVEEANKLAPLFESSILSLYKNPETDEELKKARCVLVYAASIVIKKGLSILGIDCPEKM